MYEYWKTDTMYTVKHHNLYLNNISLNRPPFFLSYYTYLNKNNRGRNP